MFDNEEGRALMTLEHRHPVLCLGGGSVVILGREPAVAWHHSTTACRTETGISLVFLDTDMGQGSGGRMTRVSTPKEQLTCFDAHAR